MVIFCRNPYCICCPIISSRSEVEGTMDKTYSKTRLAMRDKNVIFNRYEKWSEGDRACMWEGDDDRGMLVEIKRIQKHFLNSICYNLLKNSHHSMFITIDTPLKARDNVNLFAHRCITAPSFQNSNGKANIFGRKFN